MTRANGHSVPDVTVTLLTRNAGATIERLLRQVLAQDTQRSVEVVAVDSGSEDETLDVLAAYSVRVLHVAPENFDFGLTRDLAFENARAPIVVSLSQDAVPAGIDWLENLVRPLENPEVAVSCGRSVPDPERGFPQFPWERNGHFYFTREMKKFARRYGRGLSNANAAFRRSVWLDLRFGPAAIGEDFKFQTKLASTPYRIEFPDDAPVLHHHNYNLSSLYKRCRNEGLGLRELGCPYSGLDMLLDLLSPKINWVALRELCAGRLDSVAALAFADLRPVAVYIGSRFGRRYLP